MQLQRDATATPGATPCLVIATDVVRAQLRAVLAKELHPDLWGESFDLPGVPGDHVRDGVNIDAFRRQCAPILRAVEAGVDYALSEGWSVIVEGVHLMPGACALADPGRVEVCAELLVIDDPLQHAERFRARDLASAGQRPAAHYERNLPRIRAIQAELVDCWSTWRGQLGSNPGVRLIGP